MGRFFAIALLLFTILGCNSGGRDINQPKKRLSHEERFTTFNIDEYKAVVVKCDLGRLKLAIRQYEYPKLEIHKTYQKYVSFEPKGDTLFIRTLKTPRDTEQLKVRKNINLYLPNLNYLESNVSQITLLNFNEQELKIVNKSNAFRMSNCKIQHLEILNSGLCNVQLDGNNFMDNLYVKLSPKSYYSSQARVLKNFAVETKSLKNTNFSNLPSGDFEWFKN